MKIKQLVTLTALLICMAGNNIFAYEIDDNVYITRFKCVCMLTDPEVTFKEYVYTGEDRYYSSVPKTSFKDMDMETGSTYPYLIFDDLFANFFGRNTSEDDYLMRFFGAEQDGIIMGYEDNIFAPQEYVTREDLAVMAYRMLCSEEYPAIKPSDKTELEPDIEYIKQYDDYKDISPYAQEALSVLVKLGCIEGENNCINPKGYASKRNVTQVTEYFMENNTGEFPYETEHIDVYSIRDGYSLHHN